MYHVITRGVDRQDIFHDEQDLAKFLALVAVQKANLPFYLYAYCLMTNHFHLLIERRVDDIGRIMQRVLTGYAQYYNRRYRRVGHVFQGRHKEGNGVKLAILQYSGGSHLITPGASRRDIFIAG